MSLLTTELRARWRWMFESLAAGEDVPPARRLRAEGMMEAAVLLGVATEGELLLAMDACYQAAFGGPISEHFGEDWQDFYPFPQIPAMGRRAPVYPSTSEDR